MIILYMVFALLGDGKEQAYGVASVDPMDCAQMMDAARHRFKDEPLVCRPGRFLPDYRPGRGVIRPLPKPNEGEVR